MKISQKGQNHILYDIFNTDQIFFCRGAFDLDLTSPCTLYFTLDRCLYPVAIRPIVSKLDKMKNHLSGMYHQHIKLGDIIKPITITVNISSPIIPQLRANSKLFYRIKEYKWLTFLANFTMALSPSMRSLSIK